MPAYTLFVDAAGAPVFRARPDRNTGCVVAGVLVEASTRDHLTALLPKGSDGRPIKAASHEMTSEVAERFLTRLFDMRAGVGMLLLDTSSERNAKNAEAAAQEAARRRVKRGNPRVNKVHLMYGLTMPRAVFATWQNMSQLLGEPVSFFDVVVDQESLSEHQRSLLASAIPNQFQRVAGCRCAEVRWASNADEPLLAAPDIVAGTYHRQGTTGDVGRAWQVIEDAHQRGRIVVEDGMETQGF